MPRTDERHERIAKAVADAQRLAILAAIADAGELSCAALCARFSLAQATISHHLKELSGAGLLSRRREGQFAIFSFQAPVMAGYLAKLADRLRLAPRKAKRPAKA